MEAGRPIRMHNGNRSEAAVVLRPYRRDDRAGVRQVCGDTAERGESIENLYSDRRLAVDLVSRYYTDFEPQSCWVAEAEGRIVGYLMAAVNSSRHHRIMAWRILPSALLSAVLRGALWRAETWRMVAAAFPNIRRFRERTNLAAAGFPAHVHVNLLSEFRGQGLAQGLMTAFLQRMVARGVPGVQAAVRADNPPAIAFFERIGFRPLAQHRLILPARGGVQEVTVLIYGKDLTETHTV